MAIIIRHMTMKVKEQKLGTSLHDFLKTSSPDERNAKAKKAALRRLTKRRKKK